MTKTRTFKFVRKTGNLPQAIAATAINYASRKDFSVKPADGYRFSMVGYKVSAKAVDGDTLPQNFAVQVPAVAAEDVVTHVDGSKFLSNLFADYQDAIIHDVADGESKIDPTNISALIADYFDTSRAKNAITKKDVQSWLDESFLVAFIERQMTLNNTPGIAAKTSEQINMLAKGYEQYILLIVGRSADAAPSFAAMNSTRQVLEKLVEVDLLEPNDVSKHVLERIAFLTKPKTELLLDAV